MSSDTSKRPTVAILSTGDEVVGGRTVDTNASTIADQVGTLGLEVVAKITVGDYVERIAWGWEQLLDRADVVISTGGLGPTADDLTNQTVASVAGVNLVRHQPEADRIRELFESVGRSMPENNLKQADLPEGAVVVPNGLGTAPGYRLEFSRGARRPVGIVLPGVPREMKAMLADSVLPWLARLSASSAGGDEVVRFRTFQTFGMSESAVDEALIGAIDPAEGRLAFRASFPTIAVRLTVTGTQADAERRLETLGGVILDRLGEAVYAEGETAMEEQVGSMLTDADMTLATAESCTGGLIANRVTDVAGSSAYYLGGVAAYSNDVKVRELGVSPATLEAHGAVSVETAREMAAGVRERFGADLGIATTGIAGPGGGTEEKPVGTVAIALADAQGPVARMYQLWGTRTWIKMLTSQLALDWIRRHRLGLSPMDSNFGNRAVGK